jgi:hypothetical protein
LEKLTIEDRAFRCEDSFEKNYSLESLKSVYRAANRAIVQLFFFASFAMPLRASRLKDIEAFDRQDRKGIAQRAQRKPDLAAVVRCAEIATAQWPERSS